MSERPARVSHPRIRPRRGASRAATWWGKAWVRACEESAYGEGDLRAARSLARAGAVGAISVSAGRFLAAVEDGDELWTTSTSLPVLEEPDRAAFVEAGAARGRPPAPARRARRGGRRRAAAVRRGAGRLLHLRRLDRPVCARAGRRLPGGVACRRRPVRAARPARVAP